MDTNLRFCRVCRLKTPDDVPTDSMTYRNAHPMGRRKPGWYSNALVDTNTGYTARFYICPYHRDLISYGWNWARAEIANFLRNKR